jgi:Resolvase, N terminal domain
MTSRTSNRAALYLRSSKDRSDVSIDAQRRELTALASQRGLLVVGEYADVVESGTDENRPGLRSLVADIRKSGRGWDTVLLLDTSRLARKPIISVMFERDAEKHSVRVVYKSVPDEDPITAVLLKSLMMGIDQWHSLTSKHKGLAKASARAAGRHVATASIRLQPTLFATAPQLPRPSLSLTTTRPSSQSICGCALRALLALR